MDFIHRGNSVQNKPGGLYYTITGLINLIEKNCSIFPVTEIDNNYNSELENIVSKTDNSYVKISDKMPKVHLYLQEGKERIEKFENLGGTLDLDEFLISKREYDGILINMINGFDISTDDLIKIRASFHCPIYIDIHTLSRGIDENGQRYFRKVPQKEIWLSNVDIIQTNEYELDTISEGNNEFEKANSILQYDCSVLLITKGDRGAVLYAKENGELIRLFVPSIKTSGENNVGCGDIFGAAFFYSYICSNSIYESLRFANTAAGVITSYTEFDDYNNLKNDISKEFY